MQLWLGDPLDGSRRQSCRTRLWILTATNDTPPLNKSLRQRLLVDGAYGPAGICEIIGAEWGANEIITSSWFRVGVTLTMDTSPRLLVSRRSYTGITTVEVLVCIGVVIVLFLLLMPVQRGHLLQGRMAENLNNGRQIYLALRNYASDSPHAGMFPMHAGSDATALFTNSNQALGALLPRYLDDKRPFQNKHSAWCRATTISEITANRILPGENDWCYVRGLTENSDKQWPLLANAFAPGTTHYVKDPGQPGGVHKGVNAIVIRAGGSGEIVDTKKTGETFFVKRPDKPAANAFEADGEWLAGENVKVLYPMDPQSERRP
jgi:type II secretory pathway pseudopilin PulG